ncbi:MAG: DUF2891 domain-containing protein [Alteromonadaceae bacterium TMED7]|nr:hypothetical protein [Alteromonadaceae bacterium]RPH14807.1 MAG: DUF2891 domain-containing protein [Alteromonadaceae bacterium TMED7]
MVIVRLPRILLAISLSIWPLCSQASALVLTLEEANRLATLPLKCTQVEYPNKLNQVLDSEQYLKSPKALHPVFYGCFDWHSSVHGHWMMVNLLRNFPDLADRTAIRHILKTNLTAENIATEVAFFATPGNKNYERTYGWAWLLTLAAELHRWDDPLGRELEQNLQPLTDLMVRKYETFLPKLIYPIRTGEHPNTAFGLSMAYDFAEVTANDALADLISSRALHWYLNDQQCPLSWEPNGFDFLSPCFEELNLMRKVLPGEQFKSWARDFMPELINKTFILAPARVSDRTDGKLVHLDGLNFSRAWALYGVAKAFPAEYGHLQTIGDAHVNAALPTIVDNHYEGTHWLGSFAMYALLSRQGL